MKKLLPKYMSIVLLLLLTISTTVSYQLFSKKLLPKTDAAVCTEPASIMFVLDSSGSMDEKFNVGGSSTETKLQALRRVLPRFIDTIDFSRDRVGVTDFNKVAKLTAQMGVSKADALSAIAGFDTEGGTNIPYGMYTGREYLMPSATPRKYMILITDGFNTNSGGLPGDPRTSIPKETRIVNGVTEYGKDDLSVQIGDDLKNKGVVVAALGMGDADIGLLERIASPYLTDPSKKLKFLAKQDSELEEFYKILIDTIQCTTAPVAVMKLSCSQALGAISPYKINVDLSISPKAGSKVKDAYAVIAPASDLDAGYTFNGALGGPVGNSVNVRAEQPSSTSKYTISNNDLNPNVSPNTFKFDIEFLNNASGMSLFNSYNTKYDLYMYIEETDGTKNTIDGKLPKMVSNFIFDPIETCTKVYFSTSGGDLRTVERGSYQNNASLGTSILYGNSGNKFWQPAGIDGTKYQAFDNDAENKGYASTSSYTFESYSSVSPRSTVNRTNGFDINTDTSADAIKRDKNILKSLITTIGSSVSTKKLNYLEINADPSKTSMPVSNFTRSTGTPRSMIVNFTNLPVDDVLIVIDDFNYEDVFIEDSRTNTPNNIIVWCKTKSCNLKIKSVATVDSVDLTQNDRRVSYPRFGVTDLSANKSRIYLNYIVDEVATTPVDAEISYNSTVVPSTRKIELINNPDKSKVSYFLGAMFTNGYIYSSNSNKTDVIRGMVISRGIVASATNAGIRNLQFKDFPKPFMFIDYDPKYYIKFATLLEPPEDSQQIIYVGL
jgi:hypothetical protein